MVFWSPLMPDLAQVQTSFGQALLKMEAAADVIPHLRGDSAIVERRLALYRGNMVAHWTQTLAAHYPVLEKFWGEEFFAALARAYGRAFPSRHGDLACFGAQLPLFLRDFEPAREFPMAPDLAQLEWLVHQAGRAPDAESLKTGQSLLHLPGTAVLSSLWPVASVWNMHQEPEAPDWNNLSWQAEGALVFRETWTVKVVPMAYEEALALSEHLAAGVGI
ncbi:MAG: putative DNA-binding domain-containing protein [Burkholderiales bacterium]|jgi:hypothetical protein